MPQLTATISKNNIGAVCDIAVSVPVIIRRHQCDRLMFFQPTNIYRGAAVIRAGAGHHGRD